MSEISKNCGFFRGNNMLIWSTQSIFQVSTSGGGDPSRMEADREREESPEPPSSSESNGAYNFPPTHDLQDAFHFTPNTSPQLVRIFLPNLSQHTWRTMLSLRFREEIRAKSAFSVLPLGWWRSACGTRRRLSASGRESEGAAKLLPTHAIIHWGHVRIGHVVGRGFRQSAVCPYKDGDAWLSDLTSEIYYTDYRGKFLMGIPYFAFFPWGGGYYYF